MSDDVLLGTVNGMAGEVFQIFTYPRETPFCAAGSVFIRSESGGPVLDPRARDQLRDMLDRAAATREEVPGE